MGIQLSRMGRTSGYLSDVIILFVAIMYCLKANATDFIEIIRMTAEHPSILSAQSSAGAALYDVDVAKAPNNLQLSAGVSSVGYSGQPGYENNYISPHISLSKVLYDHGRTDETVKGKEAEYQMQRAQIMVTREDLNQQALSLFTTILSNAKVVAVLDQEVLALKDLLQRVKTIASIDSGRAFEVNQVKTRLNSVNASREASNTSMQQALQKLKLLVNHPVTLTNELPDLKKLGLLPDNLDIAERALMDNPSFIVARYKREAAVAAVQVASKWNRPKWSIQLSLNTPWTNGEMEPLKAATLQVTSDMNLWDGGSGIANAKGETHRLASAEQDMDATFRNLKQQLAQLWISLPLRERQISALSQQSASALQTWQAGETQFFAGQRPLTDLISFVTDYYSSMASYEEQRVQYVATQWQIVASLGKLSDLARNVQTLPSPLLKTRQMNVQDNIYPIQNNNFSIENSLKPDTEKMIEDFKVKVFESSSSANKTGFVKEYQEADDTTEAIRKAGDEKTSEDKIKSDGNNDVPTKINVLGNSDLRAWPWH